MAEKNLSPRQKMINMMYLVLTALLALNVSAEILTAFETLGDSLKTSAAALSSKNGDTSEGIKAKVADEVSQGNKKNENLIPLTDELLKATNDLYSYLDKQIEVMGGPAFGGKDPVTGRILKRDEVNSNMNYWIGVNDLANKGRGSGEAMKLFDKLNGYIDWSNQWAQANFKSSDTSSNAVVPTFPYICLQPKDDPNIPNNAPSKSKTWEYNTFHQAPLIANIAMLQKYKNDIKSVESDLLNLVKSKLGQVTFKIDSLIAIDAPTSLIVPAGLEFETKLFVAMSSKDVKPKFSGSGRVTVDPTGNSAVMKVAAIGGFDAKQKEKEQSYSALIEVPKADGTTAKLKVDNKFTVRKPEVVITSASVQNLYRSCGNKINIDVPALGDLYNPVITASSSEVIPDKSDRKVFTIVPSGKESVVSVSSNTNGQTIKIDDINYKVIPPPRPSIQVLVNSKVYDGSTPIPKKSDMTVKIVPDADFLAALPADARYQLSSVKLRVARGLGAPVNVDEVNGSGKDASKGVSLSLGTALINDPPGTKIYLEIDNIYRVNFKNQKIEESFILAERTLGAVVK